LEAIAITEIHVKNIRFVNAFGGFIMRASISAVIYTESILLGELKAHAKTAFEKKHTAPIKRVDITRSKGLKAKSLKKLKIIAAKTISNRLYSTALYIVILFNK